MKLHKPLQKDDPRLLQYVLNEISTQDLEVVHEAIAQQPEIAAEIKVLTDLYADVSDLQSAPKDLVLSPERRKKLFAETIYKNNESVSWFSKVASFGSFKYATGGLIAATFAFLVFNQSLKHEVKSSKNKADTERVSEVQFQAPASPPVMPEANEERSRGGSEVAKREALNENFPMPTQAESNEVKDQKLAKKELELPQAAPLEAPIVVAGASDKADLEQATESDAVSAAVDSADEKSIEGEAIARRAVEVSSDSKPQAQTASRSNSKGLLGGSKMFSASKAGGSVKSKDSSSGFGAGGVASKGAVALEEAKEKEQQDGYKIRFLSERLSFELKAQMRTKILKCLSVHKIGRAFHLTYDAKNLKWDHSIQNVHSIEYKLVKCINEELSEIKIIVINPDEIKIEVEPN